MRQSWETMTSVSAGHIIQTPTQPVGSGRPQRESNPGPPHQESRALPQSYRAPLNNAQVMKNVIPYRGTGEIFLVFSTNTAGWNGKAYYCNFTFALDTFELLSVALG